MHRIIQFVVLASVLLWFAVPLPAFQDTQETLVHDYVNCDFGYAVHLPKGLIGRVPSFARHGFDIALPDGRSTITVYNEYNMLDRPTLHAIADSEFRIAGKDNPQWRVGRYRKERLGGLPAIQATASYLHAGEEWQDEYLIAYRSLQTDREGNIVYVVQLSAPKELFPSALEKFQEIVRGFQLIKLPHGPC
jgi:hypothetical protein